MSEAVRLLLEEETARGVDSVSFYHDFAKRVADIRMSLMELLHKLKQDGKQIVAYGAAAKGTTQYLLIEARPANGSSGKSFPQENDLEELAQEVKQFQQTFPDRVKAWKETLGKIKDRGKKAVIWGSGSKAVAFLTTMGIRNEIEYVVDINPFMHGKFLAGTGHAIVPPDFLKEYRPDVVIAMNSIYRNEIQRDLSQMHVDAEVMSV